MIFVALAVLVLAALVGLGRKPLMARAQGRYAAFGMAAVAIASVMAKPATSLGSRLVISTKIWAT